MDVLARVLAKQFEEGGAVVVAEEYVVAAVAALGDVVCDVGNDYSRDPAHAEIPPRRREGINFNRVTWGC